MRTTDPFDRIIAQDEEVVRAPRFPVIACVVSVLFTSLGLVAAALNVRWGAAPPPDRTDVLEAAWPYVHTLLALLWLVIWPALALGRLPSGDFPALARRRAGLRWELAALVVGAVPAVGVAGFLSAVTAQMAAWMLALQMGLALLAGGALAFGTRGRAAGTVAAGVLAALAVAGPLVVYFWAEFFPAAGDGWFVLVPALAVAHAARPVPPGAVFWWLVGGCAATGVVLWWMPLRRRQED